MGNDNEDVQKQIANLTARVWRLEQALAQGQVQKSEPVSAATAPFCAKLVGLLVL